jgi:DNA topoisomerase-2
MPPKKITESKSKPDMSIKSTVRKVKQISQLDHAKRKSMWVGSKKIQTSEMFVLSDDKFVIQNLKFAPAWYKILDEIIVNAIDQWVNYPKLVTKIHISFNTTSGMITIRNNGPSIGIYEVENLNGEKMYAPQMIASEFLSGDNLDEDTERKTGGTNGAGMKLTNAFSDYLVLSTVDMKTSKHYSQTFRDRLLVIEKPVIRKINKDETESYTSIEFLPSYSVFGYDGFKPSIAPDLEKLIVSRAYQASAFTTADIYYNDKKIVIPTMETNSSKKPNVFYNFSNMFLSSGENALWHTKMTSTDPKLKKEPWELCIGVSDGKFRQVSIINGIWVYNGGSHIKHIQNLVVENLKSKVEKLIKKTKTKFNANYILNNLFIFIKCSVLNPDFTSQIKDKLDDPIEKFTSYQFKPKDYIDLWEMLEPHIMSLFLDKYKDKKKTRVQRGAVNVPKCDDAKYAGHKTRWEKCTMIICEGDSAMGTVHDGITSKHTELSYDYYGTFSIQGVPMNARKEVTEYVGKNTDDTTLIRNTRLQKNERFSSLVKVLGLDYEKTYDPKTKNGEDEFQTLRYRKVVCAVDQDDDGKGNIFGLLINFFVLFWPNLAKRGYITRFNTPIIRAYPKNKKKYVEEFDSLKKYDTWVEDTFNGDEERVLGSYIVKHFKGLGSHKKQEVPQMFKNFEANLLIYTLDSEAIKNLDAYFGTNTSLRKTALATAVTMEPSEGMNIPISEQLHRDLKAYQRDNIMRKLSHTCDGAVPSRRKVIYMARQLFGNSSSEMKVNAFVNETSAKTHYHHGETSLAGTVTKMAQDFPGGRYLPFLRPQGQFGTRSKGGKDAADPRYTFTQLTKRLCFAVFPKDDDFLLKYVFDEGKRCEPEYYVPVIPVSIMENMELPATGWKIKLWARDYKQVIKNVRDLINGKIKKATPMKIWLKDNIGEIRKYKGKEYSVGKYTYYKDKNIIVVSELPLGKYSASFIGDYASDDQKQLCNKPYFNGKPEDRTNDDGVHITFHLTEGGWKEINEKYGNETFDCVEDFMNLRTSLDDNINMIGVDGKVMEYTKYEDVLDYWFPVRKQLYADRIDRHIIKTNLLIKYLENIIRFTKTHQKYNITPKTSDDAVNELLVDHKYDTFNEALLLNPKYTKVSELAGLIINNSDGCSYEYLIKLSYRDMMESACKRREDQLSEHKEKLKELMDDDGSDKKLFKGCKTWLKELDLVESAIADGIKLGWSYGKDSARFRD